MFGFFKKGSIDQNQRFSLILSELEKIVEKTSKTMIGDLRFLMQLPTKFDEKEATELLSLALTQKIGFAVISLNLGIRRPRENRPFAYDTFSVWENSIKNKSIKVSNFVTEETQNLICNRFLKYHSDIQYFSKQREIFNHFNDTFLIEANWFAELNNFKVTEKYIRLTKNEFLQTFSYFDRFFSKYNHV